MCILDVKMFLRCILIDNFFAFPSEAFIIGNFDNHTVPGYSDQIEDG